GRSGRGGLGCDFARALVSALLAAETGTITALAAVARLTAFALAAFARTALALTLAAIPIVALRPLAALEPLAAVAPCPPALAAAVVVATSSAAAAAVGALVALLALGSRGFVLVALELVTVVVIVAESVGATALLLFIARAVLAQHAEVMLGELQIIFGLHPVARHLRVAGERPVLFEQLGGVATLAIVAGVALGGALRARSAAAATATVLPIIDQLGSSPNAT
ncbi:MAG: hypothetical protein AVDCRST_MAG39-1474, partial [uncultured Sphingomonadaceae bacterium]